MFEDWNFWVSIITAIVAIIAIILSVYQIRLSNKQHLFDRRLKAYMRVCELYSLYQENAASLSEKWDEPRLELDLEFMWLTNSFKMACYAEVIKKPLEEPFHQEFLKSLEELKCEAIEIEVIFNGKEAATVSQFIMAYADVLFSIYQYQFLLYKIEQENSKHPMTLEEAQEHFPEKEKREKVKSSFEKLKATYSEMFTAKGNLKIKKQIELK